MFIEEIELNLEELLERFIAEESSLLQINASEQAISNRLARMIENTIEDWHVDCEYNRNMYSIKQLKYALTENGDIKDRAVVPDIIVHRRLTDENLLAIEIKKANNQENRFKDHSKLTAFREQLGYKYTWFVDFYTGKNSIGAKESTLIID
ncbi:hypothetical protein [Pseudoalteromonas piratica]|uniref:hypothetical protein n=1 Tax=Pseudoalteromonas piratica TaxID=1348114 RepID=UPI00068CE760|nr:hypothetical protein [Pseudoalteromonas piratica]